MFRVPLSGRERQVLDLYDRGCTLKEIAGALGISVNTVKMHCAHILVKTMATCLRQAAWRRRRQVWVEQGEACGYFAARE